jgi:hypothetical protein
MYFEQQGMEQQLSSAGSVGWLFVQTLVDEVLLLLLVVERLDGPMDIFFRHQRPGVTITLYLQCCHL